MNDTTMMQIGKLIPYARNPRKNDGVVSQMVASIKEFGFKIPVLAKSDGTVIDGHLRLKAAHKLGMKEVPVILCDEWTAAQVKAFRIMVNKSVSWAEWDEELLKLEFDDLKALDFNLELTGFDLGEIADLFVEDKPADDDDEDIIPAADPNIVARLSIPPAVWLSKRDEIKKIFERMEKNYLCKVTVDE